MKRFESFNKHFGEDKSVEQQAIEMIVAEIVEICKEYPEEEIDVSYYPGRYKRVSDWLNEEVAE